MTSWIGNEARSAELAKIISYETKKETKKTKIKTPQKIKFGDKTASRRIKFTIVLFPRRVTERDVRKWFYSHTLGSRKQCDSFRFSLEVK